MVREAIAWLTFAALVASCAFDESGGTSFDPDGGTTPAPADPDGGSQPEPPCADADADGFFIAIEAGAACGPADCNDDNALVFPGQSGAFTEADPATGFDYDCDGVETRLVDHEVGGDCRAGLFSCDGTGWVDREPACGELADWHRCRVGFLSCREEERLTVIMPCR